MRPVTILLKVFLLAALSPTGAWPAGADPGRPPLEILFFSNRQGEIEPCGCQTGQIGGLDRLLNHLRRHPPAPHAIAVDAGDTFFSLPELPDSRRPQERGRAWLISDTYRLLGLTAFTPGERDFALGAGELERLIGATGGALVSANLDLTGVGPSPFRPYVVVTRGPWRIGITGVTGEEGLAGKEGIRVDAPVPALRRAVESLRKERPDLLVVLSHLGLSGDRAIAAEGLADVVVGSHSMDLLVRPEVVGRTVILQGDIEGRQVGRMIWTGGDPRQIPMTLVELDTRFDGPNEIGTAMKEHRENVRKLAFEPKAGAQPAAGGPFVAHPARCRSCHEAQHDFWATTKHSSAYLVLFAKNQHFNPECIGCHSLGFESPLGFKKIAEPIRLKPGAVPKVEGEAPVESIMKKIFAGDAGGPLDSRKEKARHDRLHDRYQAEMGRLEAAGSIEKVHIGVQCEHCHGNRHGHPGAPAPKKVRESSCLQCHVPPNDTDFDFKKLVAKVACPRMKK